MVDSSEITVVIPFKSGDSLDEDCLRSTVSRLREDLPKAQIFIHSHKPSNGLFIKGVTIRYFPCHDGKYQKAYLVNKALLSIKTKFIWIHEFNVILPFKKIPPLYDDKSRIFFCSRYRGAEVHSFKEFGIKSLFMMTKLFDFLGGMNTDYQSGIYSEFDLMCRASMRADPLEILFEGDVMLVYPVGIVPSADIIRLKTNCGQMGFYFDLMRKPMTFPKKPSRKASKVIVEKPDVKKEWKIPVAEIKASVEEYNPTKKIVHIIAPALEHGKESLQIRESLTFDSIKKALENHGDSVEVVLYTDGKENPYPDFLTIVKPLRTSRDVGDRRGLPYLSDMLKEARRRSDGGTVVYTNSDNSIVPDFYEKIKNRKSDTVLFHRRNVYDGPRTIEELLTFKNDVFEPGIDGVMIRGAGWKGLDAIPLDFFVGEPHWDSAFGGYMYKHGMADRDVDSLYHPYHSQVWNDDNLSVAGKNNLDLFMEYIQCGLSDVNLLATLKAPKASVVIVHYGNDPIRLKAVGECLKCMENQCFEGEIVVVELVFDGISHIPPLSSKFKKVVVTGDDRNAGIWQKEAMMNIGVEASSYDTIIFVDSDLKCGTCDWISRISRMVYANPDMMVHGYRFCVDSIYPLNYRFLSYGAMVGGGMATDIPHNPGLVWGISKKMLKENGGVNPYCLYGNGDSLFIAEYLGEAYSECQDWCVREVAMMRDLVRRGLRQCRIGYVDEDITHINHGQPMTLVHYGSKNLMTRHFSKSMDKLVELCPNGLLGWNDPKCPEREMINRRGEMIDQAAVDRVCEEILKVLEVCDERV